MPEKGQKRINKKIKSVIENLQKPKKFRTVNGKQVADYSWDIEKIWKQGKGGS